MADRLSGKRILVTQTEDFMGPATVEIFREEGAEVLPDARDLREPGACEAAVAEAGRVDVLIANLASPTYGGTATTELADADWSNAFDMMVHPLHRRSRAVLPQMIERGAGKIVCTEARPRSRECARWLATAPRVPPSSATCRRWASRLPHTTCR